MFQTDFLTTSYPLLVQVLTTSYAFIVLVTFQVKNLAYHFQKCDLQIYRTHANNGCSRLKAAPPLIIYAKPHFYAFFMWQTEGQNNNFWIVGAGTVDWKYANKNKFEKMSFKVRIDKFKSGLKSSPQVEIKIVPFKIGLKNKLFELTLKSAFQIRIDSAHRVLIRPPNLGDSRYKWMKQFRICII